MSKTKDMVIDDQNRKNETIQSLTHLMQSLAKHYHDDGMFTPPEEQSGFGRWGRLWAHETGEVGVSIDLYDLFDDGLPKCEHLEFDDQTRQDGMPARQRAFCISYNPDWEKQQVLLQCNDATQTEFDDSFDLALEDAPEETLRSITAWIESLLPSNDNDNQNK